jgi:hypothetical protein
MSNAGYKRPPPAHRFKPGESGNPSGRPKGSKNLKSLVQKLAARKMKLARGSRIMTVTTAEALLVKVFQSALAGNERAQVVALGLLDKYLAVSASPAADPQALEQQRALVAQILNARGGADEPQSD